MKIPLKFRRYGSSVAIPIPFEIAQQLGFKLYDDLLLDIKNGKLIIEPVRAIEREVA